nr:retrovirus-related Pol polyprotein from transposon TNT 1-94 [Tanacetum cinerariifolium]
MKNLNEVKVKKLRSDNGNEFKNHKLEEFCDEKGISHNFSSLCTPEQNGVAERRNRTLIEAARTMLNKPPEFTNADDRPTLNELDLAKSKDILEPVVIQDYIINEPISDVQPSPTISPSAKGILQPHVAQDRWSREKHIELVNIIGEPLAGITTGSRVRDSKAASAHECLYVNFLFEMEPKKLIEALKEEGWIIAVQEELNQFERNKVWILVPKPHGKTIIGTKRIWKNKMDENGVVIKNKARLVAQGYNQHKGIDYEEPLHLLQD